MYAKAVAIMHAGAHSRCLKQESSHTPIPSSTQRQPVAAAGQAAGNVRGGANDWNRQHAGVGGAVGADGRRPALQKQQRQAPAFARQVCVGSLSQVITLAHGCE